MTKHQFDSKLERVKKRNESIEYKRRLLEERTKYWPKLVLPSTSKLVLCMFLLVCIETLIFCQYMIITTGDTNALYAITAALFAFMGTVLGYFVKSTKENTEGGVTYLNAMASLNNAPITDSVDVVG